MATSNLSDYDINKVPSAENMSFGIIVSEWNNQITFALRDAAIKTLIKHGAKDKNIHTVYVPGSFELIYAAGQFVKNKNTPEVDAVIILGSVIQGETPHFDYVCGGVTQGIAQLNAEAIKPVIFGLLTTDNMQQAKDRAGGKYGNKGDEAAITAIKMIELTKKISSKNT